MIIDCATCPVQGSGCSDCVVAAVLQLPPLPSWRPSSRRVPADPDGTSGAEELLVQGAGLPAEGAWLDAEERRALTVLVRAGIVPAMRLHALPTGQDLGGVTDDTPPPRRRAV